ITHPFWTKDGFMAIVGHTLVAWDGTGHKQEHHSHLGGVSAAAWSRDGQLAIAFAGRHNTPHGDHNFNSSVVTMRWSTDWSELPTLNSDPEEDEETTALAWSPDSRELAIARSTNSIKVWNIEKKKIVAELHGHQDSINSLAWSPDATYLVSCSDDQTVRMWDIATEKPVNTFHGHRGPAITTDWSPNGHLIASGGNDGVLKIWDPVQQAPSAFTSQTEIFYSMSNLYSPNGAGASVEVTGGNLSEDESVIEERSKILNVDTAQTIDLDDGAAWSPDGTRFTGSYADSEKNNMQSIAIYSAVTLEKTASITFAREPGNHFTDRVSWSPSDDLLEAHGDHSVSFFKIKDGSLVATSKSREARINRTAWRNDGKLLAIIWEKPYSLELLDHSKLESVQNVAMKPPEEAAPTYIEWSEDGRFVASATGKNIFLVTSSGRPCTIRASDKVKSLGWSRERGFLFTFEPKGIEFWNPNTCSLEKNIPAVEGWANWLLASPDGERFVSTRGSDGAIRLWSPFDAAASLLLVGHTSDIRSLQWNRQGNRLVSSSDDRTVKIWDTSTGEEVLTLRDRSFGELDSVTWTGDGTKLIAINASNELLVWDIQTGKKLARKLEMQQNRH
ncbi:MAG: hypothetical protein ABSE82_16995, partial [Nitrososphaerales archaeon]